MKAILYILLALIVAACKKTKTAAEDGSRSESLESRTSPARIIGLDEYHRFLPKCSKIQLRVFSNVPIWVLVEKAKPIEKAKEWMKKWPFVSGNSVYKKDFYASRFVYVELYDEPAPGSQYETVYACYLRIEDAPKQFLDLLRELADNGQPR